MNLPKRLEFSLPQRLVRPRPEEYLGDNYVVVDFETTNSNNGSALDAGNRLLLACAVLGPDHPLRGRYGRTVAFWGGEFEQQGLAEIVRSADYIVAHNAKFEFQWLARIGFDYRDLFAFDTQIGEYVLRGNRRGPLTLDYVSRSRGLSGKRRYVAWLLGHGVCPSEVGERDLEAYCLEDCENTEGVFLQQRRELHDSGRLAVCYQRNLVTPCLADIEQYGLYLDSERTRAKHREVRRDFDSATADLHALCGEINWNSPKQVRTLLYERLGFSELCDYSGNPVRTGAGAKKADAKTIPLLEATTDKQREFKRLFKRLAPLKKRIQILEKMLECLEKDNGHVLAQFNQCITQTHRLSSTGRVWGFQFHNFPRDFKCLFRSRRQGLSLLEADAPQLEFRTAAFLGNDAQAKRDISEGADIHSFTAGVLGTSRQEAKAYTFKPLYGGNSGTPKQKAYFEAFRSKYSGIYATQDGWTNRVLKDKQLRIASGLIFYWPDTQYKPGRGGKGYITNTPSIFNYPVQSFATADIIPLSLVILWHLTRGMKSFIVNTIHDSIIAEVEEDEIEVFKAHVKEAFAGQSLYQLLDRLYGVKFDVPLGAEIKVGPYWGAKDDTEAKELFTKELYVANV